MGFFYKAGGGAGVSVHEESSYTALATAAKTLDHEQLMRDTSTDFYYKNWKTGGPGIPVPVRFFDDVTGYLTNASGNAYIQPSDAIADLTGRGWVDDSRHEGSVSKTSGNPLILQIPATRTSGAGGLLEFPTNTGNHHRYLTIVNINSYDRGTNTSTGNQAQGVLIQFALNNSGNTKSLRSIQNFSNNSTTAGKINLYHRTATSTFILANGPHNAFTSGVLFTIHDLNDDQISTILQPENSKVQQSYDEADGTATFTALANDEYGLIVFDNSSGSGEALELQITEAHVLKM